MCGKVLNAEIRFGYTATRSCNHISLNFQPFGNIPGQRQPEDQSHRHFSSSLLDLTGRLLSSSYLFGKFHSIGHLLIL